MLPSTLLINKHMKLFFITGNKTLPICNQVMICNNARCSQVIGSTQNMLTHYQIFRNSFFWPFQQALKLPEKEGIYHFPPHVSESLGAASLKTKIRNQNNWIKGSSFIVCRTIVTLLLITTFRPHTAGLHQAIVHVDLLSRNFCTTVAVSELCITKQQFARRHVRHIGLSTRSNGGHVGVTNQSCGS